jgi:hypothetical protein
LVTLTFHDSKQTNPVKKYDAMWTATRIEVGGRRYETIKGEQTKFIKAIYHEGRYNGIAWWRRRLRSTEHIGDQQRQPHGAYW